MQRKLKVDASSLWDEPANQFILRFNDLSEAKQNKFAERLKLTSRYSRIRLPNSPQVEEIKNFIKEINPVLYAEGKNTNLYWRRWNVFNVHSLSGWYHKNLNKMIYRFLCLKKEPKYTDIYEALTLSTYGAHNPEREISYHEELTRITNPLREQEIERNFTAQIIPEEMGIEDVQRARERAERTIRPLNNSSIIYQ